MTSNYPPKKALDWEDQAVSIAEKMNVSFPIHALLKNHNYFRLSGYWFPMRTLVRDRNGPKSLNREIRSDDFLPSQDLNDVLKLYFWDKKLREILFQACEAIEVALRTQVAYYLSQSHPFAHREPSLFQERFSDRPSKKKRLKKFVKSRKRHVSEYEMWVRKLDSFISREKSSDDAIQHQLDKYGDVHVWALVEIMDLLSVIKAFKYMKGKDQHLISLHFGSLNSRLLLSQLEAINNLRNKLAHHARVWNRNYSRSPAMPSPIENAYFKGIDRGNQSKQKYRIYPLICILANLMQEISHSDRWKLELLAHLEVFPQNDCYFLSSAGFPATWKEFPCWN